jgi:radical SAM superfamily enzyme YgiQ (UPF0313 family)
MEKIVLIYPRVHKNESSLIPPLSLIYIATPLKKYFKIKIIDQRMDKEWRITLRNELISDSIICAGISSMTGPQISGAIEAARIIKKFSSAVPVVWGGIHPSLLPEETIKNELVDIIVIGDGEETFTELVEVIQKGRDKKGVKGIIYKDGDSIVRTPMREQFPINKLDKLAYDLIDMGKYKFLPLLTNRKSLPIITSRGCPFRCAYCYNTEFSQRRWTSLSPEQTVSSIINLVNRYNIRGIFLLDDNFFVNLKRVRRICELLIESDLGIGIYNANCRVDTIANMDDGFLRLIKKAGFGQIFVGVESGSSEVLNKIKKYITLEQVLIASTKLKNAGIRPFYSFMAGFPSETIDDIKRTLLLMSRLLKENPDAIVYKLQLFTPFPGTELFRYASRLGMKFPESLEEWATYHYDKINYDGFNAKHKKFLKDIHYYTTFLDTKLLVDQSQYLELISKLYSKILKFRLDHEFYSLMYEHYPLRSSQKIRKRLLGKNI